MAVVESGDGNTASDTAEILRKELFMPTGLVLIGGVLVVAAGGLFFVLLRHSKAAGPPHFR